MKLFITSIYDHIAKVYTPPAYALNTSVAVRAFADAANDPVHPIGKNPGDYSMFILGEFNDDTGEFEIYNPQSSIGLAASYVKIPAGQRATEVINRVQHQVASEPVSDEALVQSGAKGGNSSKQLRPESRPQDDV